MVHSGVYAVGHGILSRDARCMAAVLAAGPGAFLSYRSAGALHHLRPSTRTSVDVTSRSAARSRPGIQVHHDALPPDEVMIVGGIRDTTPPRTLLDLAVVVPPSQLERAMHEAEYRRLWDRLTLRDLVARYPRRRGARAIKAILAEQELGAAVTRSELEERFLAFVDSLGLPRREVNARIYAGGRWYEVDCAWRDQRVAVELDGHAVHVTQAAFERDRARDRALQAAGWRVIRITWRQLHREPGAVAADLIALHRL